MALGAAAVSIVGRVAFRSSLSCVVNGCCFCCTCNSCLGTKRRLMHWAEDPGRGRSGRDGCYNERDAARECAGLELQMGARAGRVKSVCLTTSG